MGTGYNRTDSTNNIATGNIINASDLDGEFDAIDAAFDETTGHVHDGASGNGAPITKVGPAQDVVVSATTVTPKTTATLDLGTPSLKFKDLNLSGNALVAGTLGVTGNTTFTAAIISDSTTDSTSITSGAIQTDGGLGVTKALWVGGLTNIAGAVTLQSTLGVTGVATLTAKPILSSLTASQAVFSDGSKGLVSNAITGTGNVVMSASPTLTGTAAGASLSLSSLTSGRVTYAGTAGLLQDSANLTFNGTTLAAAGFSGPLTGAVTGNASTATALQTSRTIFGQSFDGTANVTGSVTSSALTSGRITYAGTGGLLQDSANMVFDGSTLTTLNAAYTGTLTGGTGVVNLGSGQFYKDASGNVGIGTSSPSTKLHVYDSANDTYLKVETGGTSKATYLNLISTVVGYGGVEQFTNSTLEWKIDGGGAASTMAFKTGSNGTERMRIDSSGNLLVGTTSASYSSANRGVVNIGGSSGGLLALISSTNKSYLMQSGDALLIENDTTTGSITFGTNASTSRMIIDSSGNVGIGTSSPSAKLDVNGQIFVRDANGIATDRISPYAGLGLSLVAGTSPMLFTVNSSERMRIDSSGNVGIGVTPSAWASTYKAIQFGTVSSVMDTGTSTRLYNNAYVDSGGTSKYITTATASSFQQAGGNFYWYQAPSGTAGAAVTFTQAMTLNASGNLLVGTTSTDDAVNGIKLKPNGDGTNFTRLSLATAATTNAENNTISVYSTGASAFRFLVGAGGTISATSIVITAISDERLKENIKDIDTGLDSIMALKPRRFDWKEGKGQDKKNAAGFIAQEFENVFPECVGLSQAGGDGIQYKDINHETLIPTLVKAMQEQQAMIEQLTTRLNALEGK